MFPADIAILIPAFYPKSSLPSYVDELKALGFIKIIIIDDGSGNDFSPLFTDLELKKCTVVRYKTNYGKGHALKVGIGYVASHLSNVSGIVTADSDGQHLPADVFHVAEVSASHPDTLVLGERDFSRKSVPRKSAFGNSFISACFALLFGLHISDTQTGLRAFPRSLFNILLALPGERYEYETQMLAVCAHRNIPLTAVPIETVYEDGNSGTHYRPLADSLRIVASLLKTFLRFTASSIVCAVVDQVLAWTIMDSLVSILSGYDFLRIFLATVVARIFSMILNYTINKAFVFKKSADHGSAIRYLILGSILMVLSACGVFVLHMTLFVDERIAKVIVDLCLFALSYRVQQSWVFGEDDRNNVDRA